MQRLDLISVPLEGTTLIEASAGTGKTYTIAALYLRMVVEQGIDVDKLLVVTYTKAATSELKQRVRERLLEFSRALESEQVDDPFLDQLKGCCTDHDSASRRVQNALLSFDLCSIYTIHGFCQRVLSDQAYESGLPFKMELLEDEGELLQQVVDDYWRENLQDQSQPIINYLQEQSISPESLAQTVKPYLHKPYLQVVGGNNNVDLSVAEKRFMECFSRVRESWVYHAEEIGKLLLTSEGLNRNSYRTSSIPTWIELMHGYLGQVPGKWFDAFVKFTRKKINEAVKKNGTAPEHPFFDYCEALYESKQELDHLLALYVSALHRNLLAYCNQELSRRKKRLRQQSYDDLLLNLYDRVKQDKTDGDRSISSSYSAALIDEFQDTDPVQYEIFSTLFSDCNKPLFLVGDPKQAIYSFRGADLFAYLSAKTDSQGAFTLDVNWRSTPKLIDAVNRLFKQSKTPFLFDQIPFVEARPSPSIDSDTSDAPFKLGIISAGNKNDATLLATLWTAMEVRRLLDGAVKVGDRSVQADDIAVLVRTNRQAEQICAALMEQGIHSVINSQQSVFHSQEALELSQVMLAVMDPTHQGRVNAALSGEMIGWGGRQLDTLSGKDRVLDGVIEQFQEYHRLWQEQGFIRMFRRFMQQQSVTVRLLGMPLGERRLTNVLHLAELLHSHDRGKTPGMEGLWKWFSRQINRERLEGEAQQLRLESDESLVQIVTVHRSKGLQYPVVFAPYTWERAVVGNQTSELFSFHDPGEGYTATLDVGSDNRAAHLNYFNSEQMSEGLRLLYVALTRAEYRCYAFWSNCKDASTSALTWLLSGELLNDSSDPIKDLNNWFKGLDIDQMTNRLNTISEMGDGDELEVFVVDGVPEKSLDLYEAADAQPYRSFTARTFNRKFSEVKQVGSFSSIVRHKSSESPDHDGEQMDENILTSIGWQPQQDIHGFPRGANAGSCIHHIFERIDFNVVEQQTLHKLVDDSLQIYGFETSWTETIENMVRNVIGTVLDRDQSVKLENVDRKRSWVEMEFYFPVQNLSVNKLRNTLVEHGFIDSEDLELAITRLSFSKLQGYMKGFVDLIFECNGKFYIVDYKSNWLGSCSDYYTHPNQKQAIAGDFYFLQYLLYTVALHRYLKLRKAGYDYETHFGAIFYLFIRGMHPSTGPDRGVFRDRPSLALIEALDRLFEEG